MIFKQITLQNFRQFKERTVIKFSTDEKRNVTILLGNNGTGKTTLAQAFTWCLYGNTRFGDKEVFSHARMSEMKPEESDVTEVELVYVHGDTEYNLKRTLGYKIGSTGKLRTDNTSKVEMTFKTPDGETRNAVTDGYVKSKVDKALPEKLSQYFLFDGERIEEMTTSMKKGKNTEFSDAVRRILGLDTYIEAMRHLKKDPQTKGDYAKQTTVIGKYNEAYSKVANADIQECTVKIQQYDEDIAHLEKRKQMLEERLPHDKDDFDKIRMEILRSEESQQILANKKRAESELSSIEETISESATVIVEEFRKNIRGYVTINMLEKTVALLAQQEFVDYGIPDINENVIQYLLKHGRCLCGQELCDGSAERETIQKLLEYVPPKSMNAAIRGYVGRATGEGMNPVDLRKYISKQFKKVAQEEVRKEELHLEIDNYEAQLDKIKDIEHLRQREHAYKEQIEKDEKELKELIALISEKETYRRCEETKRNNLSTQDANNCKLAIYMQYAEAVYKSINEEYAQLEREVRNDLTATINRIFHDIDSDGILLETDDMYHITTYVKNTDGRKREVETSTAQSNSVVFAFITGVIETAKKYEENKQEDDRVLSTEAYPLVMDAPLSSFDKSHIESICQTIPGICQQVIIFIKDTDGDIAREHLADKIGATYHLVFANESSKTNTVVKEGYND